jgi:NADH-quinone oxidoreductase subunit G
VILPGAAYTEKHATYVNIEGRPQRATRAVFPPGEAKEDWRILRALSEVLDRTLPLDTLAQVRHRLQEIAPALAHPGEIAPVAWGEFGVAGAIEKAPFASPIADFYLTNAICQASENMRRCSQEILHGGGQREATGTHG